MTHISTTIPRTSMHEKDTQSGGMLPLAQTIEVFPTPSQDDKRGSHNQAYWKSL